MTNEEAYNIISEFCFAGYEDNKKPTAKLFNAIRELVCEVHENAELRDYKARLEKENDKLKAEIEQFADELISVRIENELLKKKNELTNYYFEQYAAAIDEIEQLKRLSDQQSELNIEQFKQIDNQYQEIEQLKAELEQSVRLPCKVGDKLFSTENGYIEEFKVKSLNHIATLVEFSSFDETVFFTREEAEQSLKGQV